MKKILAAFLLTVGCSAHSPEGPSVRSGTTVARALAVPPVLALCEDGQGGAVLAWTAGPGRDAGLRLRRLSRDGRPVWGEDLRLSESAGVSSLGLIRYPGGLYAVWTEPSPEGATLLVRPVSSEGRPLWEKALRLAGLRSKDATVVPGGSGPDGSIVLAWGDLPDPRRPSVGAARILPDGTPAWTRTLGGTPGSDRYSFPAMVADGAGGAFLAYRQEGETDRGVVLQRYSAEGEALWPGGHDIRDAGGYKSAPELVTDGKGGTVVLWEDGRTGALDVYAQKVSSTGAVLWNPDGVPAARGDGNQWDPSAAPDGRGGLYLSFVDDGRGSAWRLALQRLDPSGKTAFGPGGVRATSSSEPPRGPMLVSDSGGSSVVCWREARYGGFRMPCQSPDASGALRWGAEGALADESPSYEEGPQAVSDGAGGVVLLWRTLPPGKGWEVRAARLDSSGRPSWRGEGR